MYIALETAIGLGAFISAKIYQNQVERMKYAFLGMGFFAVLAMIYLYSGTIRRMKAAS